MSFLRACCTGAAALALIGCGVLVDPFDSLTRGDGGAKDGPVADGATTCQADLANDDKNCGRCGHDCRGSACKQGLCDPLVVLNGFDCDAIDVTGGVVYAIKQGQGVFRVDVGSATKIVSDGAAGTSIAARAPYLFYGTSGGLSRANLDGSGAMQVSTAVPTDIAHNGGWVYWIANGELWRIPADGTGAAEKWGGTAGAAAAVAADDAWVAATVNAIDGIAQRDVGTGTTVQSVAMGNNIAGHVAVSSMGAYFLGLMNGAPAEHLYRADRGSPKVTDLGATANEVIDIVADPAIVVFSYNGVLPLGACFDRDCPGGPQKIATGNVGWARLALDADYIYLLESNPSIRKIGR